MVVRVGRVAICVVVGVVVVRERVGEGRQGSATWAVILRPVPSVIKRSGESANDWLALVRD